MGNSGSNLFRGAKVKLTALNANDAPTIARWATDSDLLRLSDSVPAYPRSEAAVAERLEEQRKDESDYQFGIRLAESDELIGVLDLNGIEWQHRTGWLSISIGDRSKWGRGYGSEAMQLILAYAFQELNLHRIQLSVFEYNERAIALYEKLGFQREGVWREWGERDGRRFDIHLYGLLRPEWSGHVE